MSKYDIQTIDTHVDLLKVLLWQYDGTDGESIEGLLKSKSEWYELYVAGFWESWYSDVFDIRTANEFGLSVWAIILGVSFDIPDCPTKTLNLEQKRLVVRLRFYQITTRATIPMVNAELLDIFGEGEAYALDPLDMSSITYVFKRQPSPDVALVLSKYDLLPRPSTVGVSYRVEANLDVFGFGEHNQNFENGAFYGGDVLISYDWDLTIRYDNSTGLVSGTLGSGGITQDLSGHHIAVTYTNRKTGKMTTNDVVTDAAGEWLDANSPREGAWNVTAKTQIDTEICTVIDVQSPTIGYDHTDYIFSLSAGFDKGTGSVVGTLESNQVADMGGQSVVITYTPDAANGEGTAPIGHTVTTSASGTFADLVTPYHGRYTASVSSNVVLPDIDVSATVYAPTFNFTNIDYAYGLSIAFDNTNRAIVGRLSVNQPLPSVGNVKVQLTYARAGGSGKEIVKYVNTDSTGLYSDPSPPTGYDYTVYSTAQIQGPFETSPQTIKSKTITFAVAYAYSLEIQYDDALARINGKVVASGGGGLGNQLVTLTYTNTQTSGRTVRQVETLGDGTFSDDVLRGATFTVVAQCNLTPPYGGSVPLISNTVRYRYVVPGAKAVMIISNLKYALCVVDSDEVSTLRIDYGDGKGAGSRFRAAIISKTGRYAIYPTSDVQTDATTRRAVDFQFTSSISFSDATRSALGNLYFNPMVELVSLRGSSRTSAFYLCYESALEKIHSGAFADTPNITGCEAAFSRLTSKTLHIPRDIFSPGTPVTSMARAFADNRKVAVTFDAGFLDNIAPTLQDITAIFRDGLALTGVVNDMATVKLPALVYARYAFSYCTKLTGIGYDFIANAPSLVTDGKNSDGVTAEKSTGLMFQFDQKLSDYRTMPYQLTGETQS